MVIINYYNEGYIIASIKLPIPLFKKYMNDMALGFNLEDYYEDDFDEYIIDDDNVFIGVLNWTGKHIRYIEDKKDDWED